MDALDRFGGTLALGTQFVVDYCVDPWETSSPMESKVAATRTLEGPSLSVEDVIRNPGRPWSTVFCYPVVESKRTVWSIHIRFF